MQSANEELSTLKAELAKKDGEISTLTEQVQNLKNQPTEGQHGPAPKTEPQGEVKEDLAAFADKNPRDYEALTARMKEEGLI